jgi:glycosyltransferase involved in cell wall biosynthesis
MIKDRDIICISYTTWYGKYTNSGVQILSRLAKNNRIIFIEYPFTWKDVFTSLAGKQEAPVKMMLGLKRRLEVVDTEVESKVVRMVVPPVLPVDWIKNNTVFNFFFKYNSWVYKQSVNRMIKKLGLKDPIVITAYNAFYGLAMIGNLNEDLNIYYCYDGLEVRRHGPRIIGVDEDFSRKADGIIATSDFIKTEKETFNSKCFVVKNGVDFDLFNARAKTDVTKNKRKIVGYIGSLDHRFFIDIVENAIKNQPGYDFHFTGDLRHPPIKQRLEKYANVTFFEPIKANEVPALLATYDVGIIPYTLTEYNKSIYPLKINEFLAVGVPVVMTTFADLSDFTGMVSLASTNEEFIQGLKFELENDSSELIKKRIDFAKSNSWDSRTNAFGAVLKKLSAKKS